MADERARGDARGAGGKAGGGAPSAAEWATAAAGAIVVAGVIAQLVREAVRNPQRPPDVTVRADSVARGRGGWVLFYTARNHGDATAATLAVRATLAPAGGGAALERDAEIDYLPARSERGGGFVFPADPRAGRLRLEALGYEEP